MLTTKDMIDGPCNCALMADVRIPGLPDDGGFPALFFDVCLLSQQRGCTPEDIMQEIEDSTLLAWVSGSHWVQPRCAEHDGLAAHFNATTWQSTIAPVVCHAR